MSESLPFHKPPNPNVQLAKERNRAAAERTLMAWIRTCLALISFGFGIDALVASSQQQFGATVDPVRLSRFLGLAFIALGTYAMLMATIEHQQELRHIQRSGEDYIYTPRRSLAVSVAISLVAIGTFTFIGILLKTTV